MAEQVLPWVGLAGLLLLCLPLPIVRRLVLGLSAAALRLALLAAVAGAGYLLVRPGEVPAAVTDLVGRFPQLAGVLPDPSAPVYGLALAAILVGAALPVLAVLDVCRKMNGRIRTIDELAARPVVDPAPAPVAAAGPPPRRPTDRRAAAAVIASAGR
jgi:hypothetical protein